MFDLIGGLINGAIDMFMGSAGSALASFGGVNAANQSNERIARENRDFQERMSNTAFQRQQADMHAAGLNPILGIPSGGASTPSGSTATMQDAIAPAITSARAGQRMETELDILRENLANAELEGENLVEQRKKIIADTDFTRQATKTSASQEMANMGSYLHSRASARVADSNVILNRLRVPQAVSDAAFYDSKIGSAINQFHKAIGGFSFSNSQSGNFSNSKGRMTKGTNVKFKAR